MICRATAYSHLKRGHHPVAELVRKSEEVLLPFIVIGELLYGFRSGSHLQRILRELQSFIDNPHVKAAGTSLTTADRYSRIAAALRTKGRSIPSNDIWIAAHAMETGADLVSYDRHFAYVDDLAWMHLNTER